LEECFTREDANTLGDKKRAPERKKVLYKSISNFLTIHPICKNFKKPDTAGYNGNTKL
jgi:hypothetical protein